MKKYNQFNNIFGWLSFLIAATTYLLTIEPTASFWDCGEFITSSYKLEVGHPPGAPFFMLTAKLFSLFASDTTTIAMMINAMSAIMSALTILFLFWSITHIARKLIYTDTEQEMTMAQMIAIIGSGLVGALVYTFSDTFWFSAVEAEVYAYSSMFTALVFWLILKWENRADEPGSDKWLVLIAYTMGLSIGVHLLNLLCIPAIVLVYYFKKQEKANLAGILIALLGSFLLIVALMYGIIPGFTRVGGWFELLFVNVLGMGYNTGTLVYFILLVGSIIWGLFETFSSKGDLLRAKIAFVLCMTLAGVVFVGSSAFLWIVLLGAMVVAVLLLKNISFRMLNTSILCLMVILVGYSSFALIPIRSIANPPMDQNSPEDVFTLASYLNREQYGDRPLFSGKTYASKEVRDVQGRLIPPISEKENYDKVVKMSENDKDKYVVSAKIPTYELTNTMLFPRMYSKESRHVMGYRMWGGIEDAKVPPTMVENISFFFRYQLDFMYLRYFMWNFSGRQNDIQADGSIGKGNWITGIGFIDEAIGLGPQDNLPPDIGENKGHNKYFALPLLLGILGILFQISRGRKGEQQFLITFMLFFMTGIAIILYLNQQPFEPRERDYAYAGSFYAFSIWVGLGVAFLWRLARKYLPELPAAAVVTGLALCVPIQMASENWDDHDRSDRYIMRDFAKNYLDTCEPNAILFTMGDNDTFPLWYMQEVEGFRTDVRVCNLSYLQTDWYVDQMRRQSYDSEPLPINWERDRYAGSKGQAAHIFSKRDLEQVVIREMAEANPDVDIKSWINHINFNKHFDVSVFKNEMDLGDALNILRTKDNYVPRNPYVESGVVIPSTRFTTPINVDGVDWDGLNVKPKSEFVIDLPNKGAVYRQDIMIMEMLNNINKDNWKRPMYYAVTIGGSPLELGAQSVLEGINYRILPGQIDSTGVNVDAMFDNMVNKYQWGGVDDPKVYLDENSLRMCRSFRMMFSQLISALIEKDDYERALIALDRCVEVLPGNTIPRGQESMTYIESYYVINQPEKARALADEIIARTNKSLDWYVRLGMREMVYSSSDIREYVDMKVQMLDIYQRHDEKRYRELLDAFIPEIGLLLTNNVMFKDELHPLDISMRVVLRNFMYEEDSVKKEIYKHDMEAVAMLMQKHKPKLLEKYFRN